MNQEIKYSGFSAVPSDYECSDGSLAVSINLLPEDGTLKPIQSPSIEWQSKENVGSCVYIHKNSSYTHYLIRKADSYSFFDKKTPSTINPIDDITGCVNITSLGNTLIFLTESGIRYYLWKEEQGYIFLGTHLPECPLSFGLQGTLISTDEFSITFDGIDESDIFKEFTDDNKTKITEQVLAKVNKFIAEESTSKGRFLYPFFVRYAYRLYDGTLTMHSAPILMVASSDLAPQVFWNHISGKSKYTEADLQIVGVVHQLDYAVIEQSYIDAMANWKDIIRSVDIFCSKPIYTYDQSGKCERFAESEQVSSFCICKHANQFGYENAYPVRYQKNTFNKLYAFTFSTPNFSCPTARLMLPRRSTDVVKEDIKSTSQFYMLESIKVDALTTTRTVINVKEDYLQSLVTRETMTDDYDSHDTLMPQYAFAYNARLNIANLRKKLFRGYNTAAQFCYTDGYVANFKDAPSTALDQKAKYIIYFFIKQNGKDIIVNGESYDLAANDAPLIFLYYPNVNAYKAVILKYNNAFTVYEVPLEQHAFLNGAFYFAGWDNPEQKGNIPTASNDNERIIDIPNKIYTSEANNPFYFPILGINTVGTGEIKGICSAAKALSQGQFGQFPLYAFTSEGVWALEVSSTGTYSAKQPITRDVCINPDGITQLDSAVLFPTDRGIMLISGSQTQCISEAINSEYPFKATLLPGFNKLHTMLGHEPNTDKCLPTLPFTQFLKNCQMLYDYVHQRVIVYAPGITYAYVYSLKTQQWGMMFSNLASHLNSYPEALAVDNRNAVLNFSVPVSGPVKCLYTTRPLKLDAANVLKTIDCIIQRGFFHKGNVATVLYGSRDLHSWHLVWSAKDHYLRGFRGSPYKYFRIAGVATLNADESIFGASVQFTPRQANQPR